MGASWRRSHRDRRYLRRLGRDAGGGRPGAARHRIRSNTSAASCVCTTEGYDLDAVRRAQSGDIDAFEELVQTYTPSIYRLGRAWLGDVAAPDVTQEVFLAAWRGLPRLRDPDRFRPWIHRIAINRCRSALRARGSVREIRVDADSMEEAQPSPDFRSAVEARTVVAAAFRTLSDGHRTIVALHYASGLSIREIGETLEIPDGTVKSRLNAALNALRLQVGEGDR
jgi:RNA polymerase sigma-70 factor (ECF subfamily)